MRAVKPLKVRWIGQTTVYQVVPRRPIGLSEQEGHGS